MFDHCLHPLMESLDPPSVIDGEKKTWERAGGDEDREIRQ